MDNNKHVMGWLAAGLVAFVATCSQAQAGLIFQADFEDATSAFGGTMSLNPSSRAYVNDTITGTSSMGSGNYLHSVITSAATAADIVKFTPTSSDNSWSALVHDTVRSGANVNLAGAFDMFVRPNNVLSAGTTDQQWFRPLDLDNRSNGGLRIILTGTGTSLQFQMISSSSSTFTRVANGAISSTLTVQGAYSFAIGSMNHVGFTMETDAATGRLTVKIYAIASDGAIDTSSTAIASDTYLVDATTLTLASTLGSGAWTLSERHGTNLTGTDIDYDLFRLYDSVPTTFSAIPETSTVVFFLVAGIALAAASFATTCRKYRAS